MAQATTAAAAGSSARIYYGYWLIGAAFVAQFVSVGSQNYVIGAFFKPMSEDLDWTRSEFTIARTVGQVVMAFTGFFIGAHVDRHGGRWLMLIGAAILCTALYGLSFVQELWQWVLLNGLVLTAGAAMIGNLVVNVTLAKWFVEKRGWAVGLSSMGVSMAGVALVPVMVRLVDEFGWRAGWRILAVGAAVLVVPTSFLMRRAPEDHGLYPDGKSAAQVASGMGQRASTDFDTSLTRGEALHTVSFYLLVLAFGLFGVTISVMLLQTIPFMTDANYSRSTASLMITLASIPALLSKPAWGYFIDKTDAKRLAALSAAVTGLAMAAITLSVHARNDNAVYASFLFLGFGWGGLIPLQEVIWATFFGRRYLGSVRSAGLPFSLILGAGAPFVVSYYFDHVGDYDGAFYAIAAANVVAGAVLLFTPKPGRKSGTREPLPRPPATTAAPG